MPIPILRDYHARRPSHSIWKLKPGRRHFARRSGVIVNVISGAGTHGNVGFSAYAASKGGLVGLTMTLAKELAASGSGSTPWRRPP